MQGPTLHADHSQLTILLQDLRETEQRTKSADPKDKNRLNRRIWTHPNPNNLGQVQSTSER